MQTRADGRWQINCVCFNLRWRLVSTCAETSTLRRWLHPRLCAARKAASAQPFMAVVAVASMLNLCCAGILLSDGSAACAWQVNRFKADFARALEPPHTLHAADCKAWLSADFDPDETLSFPKPQWMGFMVRSAALPLVQADQMRGSGGPNACGRPTSWKNACGAKNLAPARAARLRTWVCPGRLNRKGSLHIGCGCACCRCAVGVISQEISYYYSMIWA